MPMPLNQLLPAAESGVLIRELTLDSRKVAGRAGKYGCCTSAGAQAVVRAAGG